MALPVWTIVLTDLSFVPLGEVLNASDRQFIFTRNSVPQVKFTLRMDNPLALLAANCECYVKVYRDNVLQFFGPMIAVEESGTMDTGTFACTAMGQAWILQHHIVGQSVTGTKFGTLTDRAQIARALILEAATLSDLHITTDSDSYSGSTAVYQAGPYKNLMTCINELSNLLDGFDWVVNPTEPITFGGRTTIGQWMARPILGTTRSEAIFEFGTGRNNIAEYKLQTDRSTQVNWIFNPGEGSQRPVVQNDIPSITKWTRLEDVVELGLEDQDMRQSLVDEHIRVRSQPRRTVLFTPVPTDGTSRVPEFSADYNVGDTVIARAAVQGNVRFNGEFRIYGISVSLDDNGQEAVQLTLTDEG
jgi:hypothetical protein